MVRPPRPADEGASKYVSKVARMTMLTRQGAHNKEMLDFGQALYHPVKHGLLSINVACTYLQEQEHSAVVAIYEGNSFASRRGQ
jgi:hypothetical protein